MSWNAPTNWSEALASIERGFGFNSASLRVSGDTAAAVCGHLSTRAVLSGHLDEFAHTIIASNDDLHARYMLHDASMPVERADDVYYFVTRDGNALAYVTRAGRVVVNPRVKSGARRYVDALRRVYPALQAQAARRQA